MIVEDKYKLVQNVDKPRQDNEVRIQILPRFEDAYKKINMTFHIASINVVGEFLSLTCTYKLPSFVSSRLESMGMIDTYSLFKKSAVETGLGFATNIVQGDDVRYVYCNNKSWQDILEEEIQNSGKDNQMLDWWIDYWNNLNLVDIYDRYTTIDKDDDMMIWIAGELKEMDVDNEVKPQKVVATVHNHPGHGNSELFVSNYVIRTEPGIQSSMGSDKVYSIYEESLGEYKDYLIQDGDIHKDVFTKYEYLGECYGDYNYLLQRQIRGGLIQKMTSETIVITLNSPLLGIMRGHKLNYMRYVNDDMIENKLKTLEEAGAIDRNVDGNIPLKEYEVEGHQDGAYRLDKTVSGQYLVLGTEIVYDDGWKYNITLTRPAVDTPDIKNEDN
jgi:hypothetical protein